MKVPQVCLVCAIFSSISIRNIKAITARSAAFGENEPPSGPTVPTEVTEFDARSLLPFANLESLIYLENTYDPQGMYQIINGSGFFEVAKHIGGDILMKAQDPTSAQKMRNLADQVEENPSAARMLRKFADFVELEEGREVLKFFHEQPKACVRFLLQNPYFAATIRESGVILGYLVHSWLTVFEQDPEWLLRSSQAIANFPNGSTPDSSAGSPSFAELVTSMVQSPQLQELQHKVAEEFASRTGMDISNDDNAMDSMR